MHLDNEIFLNSKINVSNMCLILSSYTVFTVKIRPDELYYSDFLVLQIGKNRPLKQDDTTLQNPGNHKVRRNRDDLDDSEFSDAEHSQRRVGGIYRVEDSVDYSESDGLTLPPLFDIVSEGTLAKHGGDLLIHRDIYGGILSKGRIWKYLPGMICMGTEV